MHVIPLPAPLYAWIAEGGHEAPQSTDDLFVYSCRVVATRIDPETGEGGYLVDWLGNGEIHPLSEMIGGRDDNARVIGVYDQPTGPAVEYDERLRLALHGVRRYYTRNAA